MLFEHACLLGCEGIVSKRNRYRSGRFALGGSDAPLLVTERPA
jgi:hypothetical protein